MIEIVGRWLVDVAGLEPAAPCLQSRLGKTLNAFAGVAYTETHRNSRSLIVPKLYRERPELLTRNRFGVAREESVNPRRLARTYSQKVPPGTYPACKAGTAARIAYYGWRCWIRSSMASENP